MISQVRRNRLKGLGFLFVFLFALNTTQSSGQAGKVGAMLQLLKDFYVDTLNESMLTESAVKAMVKELDPHSLYMPADEVKAINEPLVGKFDGIGIQFNILNDTILVTQTIPGGPSEKLGILAGDRIVKIDGNAFTNIKIRTIDVMKKLRGDKGTKVNVSIYRRSVPDLLDYTITRDKIPLYSVDATYMVTSDIGYIKVSRFAESTADEFKASLAKLKAKGMKSLIVDLQDNGGGYLNIAVQMADVFLGANKKIVYTRGRTSMPEDYVANDGGEFEKGKLAILINESSASASEIVSGAVQDWDRGLVIGRRSFGKGLVQKAFPLNDGSAVRLTVAKYYTPSGRCIQKPYEKGDEEDYDMDISNRYKHGELSNADSIHFADTMKYYTNIKRVVYGGGGIMPDVFTPLDTTMTSRYLTDIQRKGLANEYTLAYADDNRKTLLAKYPAIAEFKKGFDTDKKYMDDFVAFAAKREVPLDTAGYKTSEAFLKLYMKALIARDLYDTNAYFEIINDINQPLTKAVEAIQNNTFEKLKIAYK